MMKKYFASAKQAVQGQGSQIDGEQEYRTVVYQMGLEYLIDVVLPQIQDV
jgi:hypothetical protein